MDARISHPLRTTLATTISASNKPSPHPRGPPVERDPRQSGIIARRQSSTSRGEFVRLVPGALPVPSGVIDGSPRSRSRSVELSALFFFFFFFVNCPVVSEDVRWMTVWMTLAEETRASDLFLRVIDGVTKSSSRSDQCETRNRGIIRRRSW